MLFVDVRDEGDAGYSSLGIAVGAWFGAVFGAG